jgi:hypothetical protein
MRTTGLLWIGWAVVAAACANVEKAPAGTPGFSAETDADDDGVESDVDCDDGDATVGEPAASFLDRDADGYGDDASAAPRCPGELVVAVGGDCDDLDAAVSPAGAEVCGGGDEDCDGTVDEEGAEGGLPFWADADGDGFGDPAAPLSACAAPTGATDNDLDCDDANSDIHPAAEEVCDGLDNTCDGLTDDDDPRLVGAPWVYLDADGDGFGTADLRLRACEAPAGWVDNVDDCDDLSAAAFPGGAEVCDGVDNDCDGRTDDSSSADTVTYYPDADGDSFGAAGPAVQACAAPAAHATRPGDCDDGDPQISPFAVEICDGGDNDCDGTIDGPSAVGGVSWYADADGDGYGDPATLVSGCVAPPGAAYVGTDCDDLDRTVFPGAGETCDGVDDDCDGATDEPGALGGSTFFRDADGDGFGDESVSVEACSAPPGYVSDDTDCDDADPSTSTCACTLTGVGGPTTVLSGRTFHSTWVADPARTLGPSFVWEVADYAGSTQLRRWATQGDYAASGSPYTISIPGGWDGTGAVVYEGFFYYNVSNTNTIAKVDLSTGVQVATLTLSGAGYRNTYAYQWGGYSDIDFAVDELGLWVIYATSANAGRMVVSHIDPATFTLDGTWNTSSANKNGVGNAFMVCGVLYATGSYSSGTTTINYTFDTTTGASGNPGLSIQNPYGYTTSLQYNPTDRKLYGWDSGRAIQYGLTIVD